MFTLAPPLVTWFHLHTHQCYSLSRHYSNTSNNKRNHSKPTTTPLLLNSSLLHLHHCRETLKYLFQKSWHRNTATHDMLELGDTVGDEKLLLVCWLQRMQTLGERSRRQEQPCMGAGATGHLGTGTVSEYMPEKRQDGLRKDSWKQQPKSYSGCPQAVDLPGWSRDRVASPHACPAHSQALFSGQLTSLIMTPMQFLADEV